MRLYCELVEDIEMEEQRVFVKWAEERKATKEVKVARGGVKMAQWHKERDSFIWENNREKLFSEKNISQTTEKNY